MAEKRDSIQELLIAARREQILDAAVKVFSQKGFHVATVRDIAREAGIADGTIYNYFENKTGVLLGILKRLNESEQREQHFEQGEGSDLRGFFVVYLRQRMRLLWPNAEVFRAVLPEILVNAELRELYYQQVLGPTFAIAERYFAMLMEQGRVRKVDVPLSVRALAGTVLGLLMTYLLGDKEIEERWEELPEVLATLLLDGLIEQ